MDNPEAASLSAAQRQIEQMTQFIAKEAQDKAKDIETKGAEEFSIEKFRIVNQQKEKIRQEFARKAKQEMTKLAIARSTAINRSRLEKIKERQEVLTKICGDVKGVLAKQMEAKANQQKLITELIVQGCLMLLEDEVTIQCRQTDVQMVEACLKEASSMYSKKVLEETTATKTCKLSVDKTTFVPKESLGGVILKCSNDLITIDNTIDLRLQLVLEQDKPAIRQLLFPPK